MGSLLSQNDSSQNVFYSTTVLHRLESNSGWRNLQSRYFRTRRLASKMRRAASSRWTSDEDDLFRRMAEVGTRPEVIAAKLNRPVHAIRARAYTIGLPLKWFKLKPPTEGRVDWGKHRADRKRHQPDAGAGQCPQREPQQVRAIDDFPSLTG